MSLKPEEEKELTDSLNLLDAKLDYTALNCNNYLPSTYFDTKIPELLARIDVANSRESNTAYLPYIEYAMNIGYGIQVMDALPKLIKFAEDLLEVGAVSYKKEVEVSSCDRRAYCKFLPAGDDTYDVYEVWYITQSSAFVTRLSSIVRIITEVGCEYEWIPQYAYSAREITQDEYRKGKFKVRSDVKYFSYNDCRDRGYAGTLKGGVYPYIDYVCEAAGKFKHFFNTLCGSAVDKTN